VIRVRDLDEAVTAEEVVAVIVARGVAQPREVRASITRSTNGMGMAWVRCPVVAAGPTWPGPAVSESDGQW